MARITLFLAFWISASVVFAQQYPANSGKLRLGFQTTALGLVYYSDEPPTEAPTNFEKDTEMVLDSVADVLWRWKGDAWYATGRVIDSLPPLPRSATDPILDYSDAVWQNTQDSLIYYYEPALACWKTVGAFIGTTAPENVAATDSTGAVCYEEGGLWYNTSLDTLYAYIDTAWVELGGASGTGGMVDSTRIVGDSIAVYYQDGSEVGRDTIRPSGALAGSETDPIALPALADSVANIINGDTKFNLLSFNIASDSVAGIGKAVWNSDAMTLDIGVDSAVTLQVGQEMYLLGKNQTGSAILNGDAVQFAGGVGASGRVNISLSRADTMSEAVHFIGIATEDIANGEDGFVTVFGKVRGIDTDGSECGEVWAEGDILYLSASSAGCLTKTEPTAPNFKIPVAVVVSAGNTGTLLVRPTLFPSLNDIHNVNISSPADNEVLAYDSGTGTWINQEALDTSNTNEIQTISKAGSTVTLSNGGGSFTDAVDDADADPANEIQTLDVDFSGDFLTFSLTGSAPTFNTSIYRSGDITGNGSQNNPLTVDFSSIDIGFTGDVGSPQQIQPGGFLDLEGGFGVATVMSTDKVEIKADTSQLATVWALGDSLSNIASGTGWLKDSLEAGDVSIAMNRNQLSFTTDIPFTGGTDTLISLSSARSDVNITPYFLSFNFGSSSAGFVENDTQIAFYNTVNSEGLAYEGDYFNSTSTTLLKPRQIPDIQTVRRIVSDSISTGGGSAFWEDASGTVRTVSASSGLDFVFGSTQLDNSESSVNDERFLFDNSKGYFFAGSATDSVANDANRGFYSASFGLDNMASGYTSSVTGGERNIASGNDSHIGGGQNNTVTNLGGVVTGGRFNVNESLYGSIGGGTLNEIPNTSAEYATIPGGYKAKAELYGALTHASGAFDTDSIGQAQNMQVTVRGEGTGTSDFDLFLDGGARRVTIPNNAFWSLTGTCITVVVDIGISIDLEEGDSNADLLIGKAQNYEGTVITDIGVVGGTGTYDDPDGDMIQSGVLITADDTNNALKVTCTPPSAFYGGTATTVTRAACTLMITQLKY